MASWKSVNEGVSTWQAVNTAYAWHRRGGMALTAILAVVGLAYLAWPWWDPSVESVVAATTFNLEDDEIRYEGQRYEVGTADDTEQLVGYLHQIRRDHEERFPVLTHDIVLVTGDFNDPERVTIHRLRSHTASWEAQRKPEGKFLVAHLIPRSAEVADALQALRPGERVSLEVYRVRGDVRGPDRQIVWRYPDTFVLIAAGSG